MASLTVDQAIDRLARLPGVKYIEPNHILHAAATPGTVPSDPFFGQQWALNNTGQTGGTPSADIEAIAAWNLATGSPDVTVAILDSGIELTHPDLVDNLFVNPGEIAGNGIDDDGNGYVDDTCGWDFVDDDNVAQDDNGHGTFSAGIVGAAGDNGAGISGVSWDVSLIPLKFLDANGSGTTAGAILALDYAIGIGARITNNSWGGGPFSQALLEMIQAADQAGIPFVASAGASSTDIDVTPYYPASYDVPNVLVVAATDHDDLLVSSSNWGPKTVDLAAPGAEILTTYPGASYRIISGTSTATAHVSGALALVVARFPGIPGAAAAAHLQTYVEVLPSLFGLLRTEGRLNAFLPLSNVPTAVGSSPRRDGPRLWWQGSEGAHVLMGADLAVDESVLVLRIVDVRGRLVREISLGPTRAGQTVIRWDGRDDRGQRASRGAYLAHLRCNAGTATARVFFRP